jgi:hypothetical protein
VATKKTKARKAPAKKRNTKEKPLKVNSNGALKKAAGVTKSGKVNVAKARKLAKGKGKTAAQARFFLNVLRKK